MLYTEKVDTGIKGLLNQLLKKGKIKKKMGREGGKRMRRV
jgi:hypothetical protein